MSPSRAIRPSRCGSGRTYSVDLRRASTTSSTVDRLQPLHSGDTNVFANPAMPANAVSPSVVRRPSSVVREHRDFLAIPDFSRDELESLFVLAERMRNGEYNKRPLE